jgi:hypothetical protein
MISDILLNVPYLVALIGGDESYCRGSSISSNQLTECLELSPRVLFTYIFLVIAFECDVGISSIFLELMWMTQIWKLH